MKSDVDKLNIDILKTTPNLLNNLKGDLEILDITKLYTILVDLKKCSNVAKNETVKDQWTINLLQRLKVMRIKFLVQLDLHIITKWNWKTKSRKNV